MPKFLYEGGKVVGVKESVGMFSSIFLSGLKKSHQNLQFLDFSKSSFNKAIERVTSFLEVSYNLQLVDFSECKIGVCDVDKSQKLVAQLAHHKNLEALSLAGNNINSPDFFATLAESLASNPSLVQLDLSGNHLGVAEVKSIISSLKAAFETKEMTPRMRPELKVPVKLNLSNCDIGGDAIAELAKQLRGGKVFIQELDLSGNAISADLAQSLTDEFSAIKMNFDVKKDLPRTSIYQARIVAQQSQRSGASSSV